MAHKDQILPFLGQEPTLLHNWPRQQHDLIDRCHNTKSNEFPVQYFFYSKLACTARLSQLLEVPEPEVSVLRPVKLLDGRIRAWANKYRALVDCPAGDVEGYACAIGTEVEEDALRRYEGDSYEVVAARFLVGGMEVVGRAFRFAGCEDELL